MRGEQTGERMPDRTGVRTLLEDNRDDALFSEDRTYRYCLRRTWDASMPTLAFLMLNPSTADATADDPTIRRCIGYARRWGYGTLLVGNLFALRSTDPRQLYDHSEPVGPDNDAALHEIVSNAERTIAAWGTHGALHGRGYEVTEQLDATLYALDTTQDGHPNHPLYQPKDADPECFDYA
jgi:hypothetical protein